MTHRIKMYLKVDRVFIVLRYSQNNLIKYKENNKKTSYICCNIFKSVLSEFSKKDNHFSFDFVFLKWSKCLIFDLETLTFDMTGHVIRVLFIIEYTLNWDLSTNQYVNNNWQKMMCAFLPMIYKLIYNSISVRILFNSFTNLVRFHL